MADDISTKKKSHSFTDIERDAMRARAQELRAEERTNRNKEDGERDVQAAIAKMSEADKSMAEKLDAIVKVNAPELLPKTWYGMPAYANKEGKVICFFQPAERFKVRYATFGFNDTAKVDEGEMWPVAYALRKLTSVEEEKIAMLVKKAVS